MNICVTLKSTFTRQTTIHIKKNKIKHCRALLTDIKFPLPLKKRKGEWGWRSIRTGKKSAHNDNDSYRTVENMPRPAFACSVDMFLDSKTLYTVSRWWTRVASWDRDTLASLCENSREK